ncbi:hypothetical protein GCM10027087_17140 [Paractinoplanes abujensis]
MAAALPVKQAVPARRQWLCRRAGRPSRPGRGSGPAEEWVRVDREVAPAGIGVAGVVRGRSFGEPAQVKRAAIQLATSVVLSKTAPSWEAPSSSTNWTGWL